MLEEERRGGEKMRGAKKAVEDMENWDFFDLRNRKKTG
jgi:hypothetical protein